MKDKTQTIAIVPSTETAVERISEPTVWLA